MYGYLRCWQCVLVGYLCAVCIVAAFPISTQQTGYLFLSRAFTVSDCHIRIKLASISILCEWALECVLVFVSDGVLFCGVYKASVVNMI